MHELFPEAMHHVGHRLCHDAGGGRGCRSQRLHAFGSAAVAFAEGQPAPIVEMADGPVFGERGLDLGQPAKHAFRTKRRIEPFEMREPVEQRQEHRMLGHGRPHGPDRAFQIVGLAGKQHDVPARRGFGQRCDLEAHVAERAFDPQAVLAKRGGTGWPHEKADAHPGLL